MIAIGVYKQMRKERIMAECSECKDCSKYATDAYKPYCRIIGQEVSRSTYEMYCNSYSGYKQCPVRKKKYGR